MFTKNTVLASHSVVIDIRPYLSKLVNTAPAKSGKFAFLRIVSWFHRITPWTNKHPQELLKSLFPCYYEEIPITNREIASELNNQPLSQETVQSLQELGDVFRQIHRRLVSEGYTIRNGKITKPGSRDTDNGTK